MCNDLFQGQSVNSVSNCSGLVDCGQYTQLLIGFFFFFFFFWLGNNNNNNIPIYGLFLQVRALSPLQSKEPKRSQNKLVYADAENKHTPHIHSHTHTHARTHTLAHTNTLHSHTHSLSLSFSHTHTHTYTRARAHTRTHTHTHSQPSQ